LWGDGDFGAAGGYGVVDFVGGVVDGRCEDWGPGGEGEPLLLFFGLAGVVGVGFAASAHEARADSGDADALVAKFGVEAFGEADEGKLAGDVGEHVGHGEFATDAGDVDDRSVFGTCRAAQQMG